MMLQMADPSAMNLGIHFLRWHFQKLVWWHSTQREGWVCLWADKTARRLIDKLCIEEQEQLGLCYTIAPERHVLGCWMDWIETSKVRHFGGCCSSTIFLTSYDKSWWIQRDTLAVPTMFKCIWNIQGSKWIKRISKRGNYHVICSRDRVWGSKRLFSRSSSLNEA